MLCVVFIYYTIELKLLIFKRRKSFFLDMAGCRGNQEKKILDFRKEVVKRDKN